MGRINRDKHDRIDTMKYFISAIIIVIIIIGLYGYNQGWFENAEPDTDREVEETEVETEVVNDEDEDDEEEEVRQPVERIGTSVEGRDITAYHYGDGEDQLLFVGGIHGGYEWNTVLVARELMSYLESNPEIIPENITVTVIPVLNPDGLVRIVNTDGEFTSSDVSGDTVPGRFNANNVDLNRNFDCEWQSSGTWQNRTVDGGDAPFSEPESQAIRDYVEMNDITAAVVWYSAAGVVFSSSCNNGVMDETLTITDLYARASGYPAYEEFNFYAITGDMVNWLAKNNIPAISVLLSTHQDVEWSENRAGIEAMLEYYTN